MSTSAFISTSASTTVTNLHPQLQTHVPSSSSFIRPSGPLTRYSKPVTQRRCRLLKYDVVKCAQRTDSNKDEEETPTAPSTSSSSSDYLSQLNEASERRRRAAEASGGESADEESMRLFDTILTDEERREKAREEKEQQEEERKRAMQVTNDEDNDNDNDDDVSKEKRNKQKIPYAAASRALWRLSWVCWWPQFTLTAISCVIILFSFAFPSVNISTASSTVGLILVSASIIFSLISLVFTYSYTRLSIYLNKQTKHSSKISQVPAHINTRLTYGLAITLIGLLISSLGLQAVVGTLLSRLLTSGFGKPSGSGQYPNSIPNNAIFPVGAAAALVQPIDILVVQACANVTLALLLATICTCWFMLRVKAWEKKAQST